MNFTTQIPLEKQPKHLIDYNSKLLLLGSCFSENIGNKLQYYKFQTTQNPFGILFHSKAIESFISNVINEKVYTEKDIFFHNERWHCFEAHSSLSALTKEELIEKLNNSIHTTKSNLKEVSHVVITLGTAWVYREIASDTLVANCHKVPQKKFLKELLSITEIAESLAAIKVLLKSINPKLTIIFTVSPVRHIKDGFVENMRSKAHLLSAIHQVVEKREQTFYFPSYELMMDELRDYRFYAEDMIHPNQTAINFIWEKFKQVWLHESTETVLKQVVTIQKGLAHRSFNPNSEAHQQFLANLELKRKSLEQEYPFIKFNL